MPDFAAGGLSGVVLSVDCVITDTFGLGSVTGVFFSDVVVVVTTIVVFFSLSLFADSSCIFVISSSASCKYFSAPNIAMDSVPFTSASLLVLVGIVSSNGDAAVHITTSGAGVLTSGFLSTTSPLIDVGSTSDFCGDLTSADVNGEVVSVFTGDEGVFELTPSGDVLGSTTSDFLAAVYGATGVNDALVVGEVTFASCCAGAGHALSAKDDLSAGFLSGVSTTFTLMSDVFTSSRGVAVGFADVTSASGFIFVGTSYLKDIDGTSYRMVDELVVGVVVGGGVASDLSFGVTWRPGSEVVLGAASGAVVVFSLGVLTSSVLTGAASFFANGCFPNFRSTTSYGFVSG